MARLLLFSDVHGDAYALASLLLLSPRFNADEIWCAGDLVDDGPDSSQCVKLAKLNDVKCVRGNHERWAKQRGMYRAPEKDVKVPADEVVWLDELPLALEKTFDRVSVGMWHAYPRGSDMEFLWYTHDAAFFRAAATRANVDFAVVGHTHTMSRITVGKTCLIGLGALTTHVGGGLPFATPATYGSFGVLDTSQRTFTAYALGMDNETLGAKEIGIYERTIY